MNNCRHKAKIFLSCGQSDQDGEQETARNIRDRLEPQFDVYVAVHEQSLVGLKENIFRQLETSDYFIFVDFKREPLGTTGLHRGSLFSNQELAIASFLDLPVIGYREDLVKPCDGILQALQANFFPFCDKRTLPGDIATRVREANWEPLCPNCLVLARDNPNQKVDTPMWRNGQQVGDARYFQITVKNKGSRKIARDCYAYLERVKNRATGKLIPLMNVEFKWEAYPYPNAIIRPTSERNFDAFHVDHSSPQRVRFKTHTDYWDACPKIPEGPGEFELTYSVVSDNLGISSATFLLSIGKRLEDIRFEKIADDLNCS